MRSLLALSLAALLAAPAAAQGFRQPPPDHWMTLDSLVAAVGLTAAQKDQVAKPYASLNGVMKDAADLRIRFRQEMMSKTGGQMPTPEQRQAMQPALDSMRTQLQQKQDQVDGFYQQIRGLLTSTEQPKFDALAKPSVLPQRRGGMGAGPGR